MYVQYFINVHLSNLLIANKLFIIITFPEFEFIGAKISECYIKARDTYLQRCHYKVIKDTTFSNRSVFVAHVISMVVCIVNAIFIYMHLRYQQAMNSLMGH